MLDSTGYTASNIDLWGDGFAGLADLMAMGDPTRIYGCTGKANCCAKRFRKFSYRLTRQMNSARSLYGKQLMIPKLSDKEIRDALQPMLAYYAERDRGIIADRVAECILTRQKTL